MKSCYAENVFKMASRDVLNTSSRRLADNQMFAGLNSRSAAKSINMFDFLTLYTKLPHQKLQTVLL